MVTCRIGINQDILSQLVLIYASQDDSTASRLYIYFITQEYFHKTEVTANHILSGLTGTTLKT